MWTALKKLFNRKKLNSVAGILDKHGGLRVVCSPYWRMWCHIGPDEEIFIIPNLKVPEPVPWGGIAPLIEVVEKYVEEKSAGRFVRRSSIKQPPSPKLMQWVV